MNLDFQLDDVKIVQCKECGVDVKVNVNYPITQVDCQPWYCPKQTNEVPKTITDSTKT